MTTAANQYGFGIDVDIPFAQAIDRVTAALKEEGFGVLTTIDIQQAMKQKLDVDFEPYTILGACNPPLAYRALQADHNIGLLLPCNIVIQSHGERTRVDIVDPVQMMGMVNNPTVTTVAEEAAERLHRVLDRVRQFTEQA